MTEELIAFLRESNAIEGILRDPTPDEIDFALDFMSLMEVHVGALNTLQAIFAPGMPLRDVGMNVQVGNYVAPPGGPQIPKRLKAILGRANNGADPWEIHCRFEMLHPYMDGNGRTGRVLWAWQMHDRDANPFIRPFLHSWYYMTLEHSR